VFGGVVEGGEVADGWARLEEGEQLWREFVGHVEGVVGWGVEGKLRDRWRVRISGAGLIAEGARSRQKPTKGYK
jgi:hypothetical protein